MMDTVRIPPWNFHRQLNEAVAEELNKKLANKVCYTSNIINWIQVQSQTQQQNGEKKGLESK